MNNEPMQQRSVRGDIDAADVHLRIGRLVLDADVIAAHPGGLRSFEAALLGALGQQLGVSTQPLAGNSSLRPQNAVEMLAETISAQVGQSLSSESQTT